jgi:hypothetical protein
MKVNSPLAGVAAIVPAEQGGARHATADGPDHPSAGPNMHFRNPALRDGGFLISFVESMAISFGSSPQYGPGLGVVYSHATQIFFVLCGRRSCASTRARSAIPNARSIVKEGGAALTPRLVRARIARPRRPASRR